MPPTITAFRNSPDQGRGQARDMRVRWAMAEMGLPYDVHLVTFAEMKQAEHLAHSPFGQIPTFEDDGLVLFESGAIILHIAGRGGGLLPADPIGRDRAIMWIFAGLNTIEPPIVEREQVRYLEQHEPWYGERLPLLDDRVRARLDPLSRWLGERDWLEDGFTAGDLVMVMVLRRLEGTGLLEEHGNLAAYVARAEARPAYQEAFAAQAAVFAANQPGG